MQITSLNFLPLLINCINDLSVIVSRLKEFEQDDINNHPQLIQLNGQFIRASQHLPDIIQFIADNRPDPTLIGDNLQQSIQLVTSVIQEKTRILENTPPVFIATNDMSCLN